MGKGKYRNRMCWCGSQKSFKDCHGKGGREERVHLGQYIYRWIDAADQVGGSCWAPVAIDQVCGKDPIRSHTMQRKGVLTEIVRESDKSVASFFPIYLGKTQDLEPRNVSWNDASTFPGFCSFHDTILFEAVEGEGEHFSATFEECFVLAYRALCYQVYQKQRNIAGLEDTKSLLLTGLSGSDRSKAEKDVGERLSAHRIGRDGFRDWILAANKTLCEKSFDDWSSCVVWVDGSASVVSTGALGPSHDLEGKRLQNVRKDSPRFEVVCHSILPVRSSKLAIIYSWPKSADAGKRYVESVVNRDASFIPNTIVDMWFCLQENTCFAWNWWCEWLDDELRKWTRQMTLTDPSAEPLILVPPGQLVDWEVSDITWIE